MESRCYLPSDYPELVSWCVGRKIVAPAEWCLSSTGIIIPGKVVGFLYTTNSGVGYMDNFHTNVNASDRLEAFKAVTLELLERAKILGVRGVVGSSTQESITHLCESLGFMRAQNCTMVGKEI